MSYWRALKYPARWAKQLRKVTRDYYSAIVEEYQPATFLDVGCAVGYTSEHVGSATYYGLDHTYAFIEIAKLHYTHTNFMQGDANALPFASNSMDLVTCRALLEHLADPEQAIMEMARVSKQLVVIVWYMVPRVKEVLHYNKRGYYENKYALKRINGYLQQAQLQLIDQYSAQRHKVWVLLKEE